MQLPKGPWQGRPIVRLLRSLYGLKQAAYCWHSDVDAYIVSIGYHRATSTPGFYFRDSCYILIWVDDIFITGDAGMVKNAVEQLRG